MDTPKWIPWAGLAAILGGLMAIVLTVPFASAYFSAYPGYDVPPFWLQWVRPMLRPFLTFESSVEVYNTYGRIYDFVYLLCLPAVFGLHHLHQGVSSRIEKWGFGLLVVGMLTTFIGVAGDYWANGAGFFIELLGLLTLSIGTTLYGVAMLRSRVIPRWCGWLLVSCLPGAFIFTVLIGHIPSGPTFLSAVSWLIVGSRLLFKRGIRPQPESQARANAGSQANGG